MKGITDKCREKKVEVLQEPIHGDLECQKDIPKKQTFIK